MERLACSEYQVAEADVFASVYVWHGVCVYVLQMSMHTRGGQRMMLGVLLYHSLPCSLEI